MKKKVLITVLCMVMAISGISTGCSNKTEKPNKKQEASTTEKKKVETKDTEEKESKKFFGRNKERDKVRIWYNKS